MPETPQNDQAYLDRISRNLGLLSQEQQEKLRSTRVAMFGLGGIGGAAFEILLRSGIRSFSIVDKDVFDASNLNRQIFAFLDTIGRRKIDVAEQFARKIDAEVKIDKYLTVTTDNVGEILEGADVAVMAIDQLKPVLIASRRAREQGIPLVEGWALPYGNVRVFTDQTPSLESAYHLPTEGKDPDAISDEEYKTLTFEALMELAYIEGLKDYYSPETVEKIRQGHISSFGPMVWMTSVFMAVETSKILLGMGEPALGPKFKLYDPFAHRVPQILGTRPEF